LIESHKLNISTTHVGADAFVRRGRAKLDGHPSTQTSVFFDGKKLPTHLYSRDELEPGRKYLGPAIITEYSATTVISPDRRFRVDQTANLIVNIR
jgi:N-methylhydantoinase A/oxoprolinase/acetone carboxylase beta subunit